MTFIDGDKLSFFLPNIHHSKKVSTKPTIKSISVKSLSKILLAENKILVFDVRTLENVIRAHIALFPAGCPSGTVKHGLDKSHRILVQIYPKWPGMVGSSFEDLRRPGSSFCAETDYLEKAIYSMQNFDFIILITEGEDQVTEKKNIERLANLIINEPKCNLNGKSIYYLEGGMTAWKGRYAHELKDWLCSGFPTATQEYVKRVLSDGYLLPKSPKLGSPGAGRLHLSRANVSASLPTSLNRSELYTTGVVGIRNIGNTCYMSSIIQCLNATRQFSEFFRFVYSREYGNGGAASDLEGELPLLSDSFSNIISLIWTDGVKIVDPSELFFTVGKYSNFYNKNVQQDAEEFLIFFLDRLDEELKKICPIGEPNEEPNSIVSIFMGVLRSQIKCLGCNKTSTTESNFISLSIPLCQNRLFNRGSASIPTCIRNFLKEEVFKGMGDSRICPNCKKSKEFFKRLGIVKYPKILILHLKRFHNKSGVLKKFNLPVDIPLILTFPKGSGDSNMEDRLYKYELYAISNHYGGLDNGHYVTYARVGANNTWYSFDDTTISTKVADFTQQRNAYIIMYKLCAAKP